MKRSVWLVIAAAYWVTLHSYPDLRGREGQSVRITWKTEDVQLLRA